MHRTLRGVVCGLAGAAAVAGACSSPTGVTPPPVGPPSLTCPGVTTAEAPVGTTTDRVTFAPPTLTGGTPAVTVSCLPASGSTFPLGSTTVTCQATDAIGRTAVCTASVVVSAHTIAAMTVVAFGDSITAGENGLPGSNNASPPVPCAGGSTTSVASRRQTLRGAGVPATHETPQFIDGPNSYPTQLQNTLEADFPSQTIAVLNEGMSEETAASGVGRLSNIVLPECRPDTLLLLEGINDLAGAQYSMSAMTQVTADLQTDIQNASAAGVSFVFVSTLLPQGTCTMTTCRGSNVNNQAIVQANKLITAMVAGESASGAVLVDVNAAYTAVDSPNFTTLIDTDGLHPTPAGNAKTAQTFLSAILAKVPVLSHRPARR
jgi:lysophospholipase L1-like esterase